ncbi:hypothetical protein FHX08_002614 [Rhizobium sp. BK529]|uniref:DUF6656 family protein n=1 Tax=unclassified Rhizobium TaxID=2613769 RepID=UPI00104B3E26|nr:MULTISPECIES: DUF6656 family protein [unclassified Rhizobium]MBB3592270.1 hypothetical protein [Rhizobium sp. BK529]TCS06691.1 hypothetical protein EV281_102296 [Rhizobium sp. BK418]
MAKLRYFDKREETKPAEPRLLTKHSEFLRTGRISRRREDWLPEERRYLTHEEVAEKTARKLQAAGEKTHQNINGFHRAIQFPKMIFHRTLADSPHLGYCHVTASRTKFAHYDEVAWAFYIANFYSDIGDNDNFFDNIAVQNSRMYFAVAIKPGESTPERMVVDRSVRGNGLLFRTNDPQIAIRNILLLGARNEQLRQIIRQL